MPHGGRLILPMIGYAMMPSRSATGYMTLQSRSSKRSLITAENRTLEPRISDNIFVIIDEAAFFFPESACNIFTEIKKKTHDLIATDCKGTKNYDRNKSVVLADELEKKFESLPKLFEPVLSFSQLTKEL
jgi:hypothetical protein